MSKYIERKKQLGKTFKPREEWWSRVFATPIALRILYFVADWRFLTPNRLTMISFFMTLLTAGLILIDSLIYQMMAAILLQLAYIFDCMDGQLARYRNSSSKMGSYLDKWSDYVKFPVIILALTYSAFREMPSFTIVLAGYLSLFLICYLPYLKGLAKSEAAIEPWDILSKNNFLQRNLRFFLFEEAQWYMFVSLFLVIGKPSYALWAIAGTQLIKAVVDTIYIFYKLSDQLKK